MRKRGEMSTEEGVFARIPLADVTLAEAKDLVDDSTWFEQTRIPVLYHFPQVTIDGYWDLSVGDHRELVRYLEARGLI